MIPPATEPGVLPERLHRGDVIRWDGTDRTVLRAWLPDSHRACIEWENGSRSGVFTVARHAEIRRLSAAFPRPVLTAAERTEFLADFCARVTYPALRRGDDLRILRAVAGDLTEAAA